MAMVETEARRTRRRRGRAARGTACVRAGAWLVLVVALGAAEARAWDDDGHRIVARIAEANLTPEARRLVRDLLGDASLSDVATWADEIKSRPEWRWTGPLHYVNVPDDAVAFDVNRDCPPTGCVVSAIYDYARRLRDAGLAREERAEALRFLVHFVGDVHQPLHVSRASDRGGNDVWVVFFGERERLHWVWDGLIIRRLGRDWPALADELAGTVSEGDVVVWCASGPVEWAQESFRLAMAFAYAVPEDGHIGEAYWGRAVGVARRRLAMAGIRLAGLLNAAGAGERARRPAVGVTQPFVWLEGVPKGVAAPASAPASAPGAERATTRESHPADEPAPGPAEDPAPGPAEQVAPEPADRAAPGLRERAEGDAAWGCGARRNGKPGDGGHRCAEDESADVCGGGWPCWRLSSYVRAGVRCAQFQVRVSTARGTSWRGS